MAPGPHDLVMETRTRDPIHLAREHLDAALEHATDDAARYHIRTALQAIEALPGED